MKITLYSGETIAPPAQIISFFTEDSWKKNQESFNQNLNRFFNGKKAEVFTLTEENRTHYLVGLGNNPKASDCKKAADNFSQKSRKSFLGTPTLLQTNDLAEIQVKTIVEGLFLGTYQYTFKPEHPFWDKDFALFCPNIQPELLKQWEKDILAVCRGQFTAMDWLNKPQNLKGTAKISEFLKETSTKYGFKHKVLDRAKAEKEGLGAFLAVNRGSEEDGAFTIIEYDSGIKTAKTVGLVGKCVLFDTGGISLKGGDNMHYMKSDMGGAAAVIGTLIAAAEMKLKVNLVAVLPITDNAISEKAYVPSDVITAYNGKTIEVLNTDAEGRMTLADGLSYMSKNYKTDYMLDLATLTGSAVRMFGDTCGALFSNDENLKDALLSAGDETGQRLWNLPLWDVWKEDITAEVADLRNISLKPVGDCIVAAKFLEQFIENHPAWAHMDIAGVAFGNVNYAKEKSATGYGVSLLIKFLAKLQQ